MVHDVQMFGMIWVNTGSRCQAYCSHWKVVACHQVATSNTIFDIVLLPRMRILLC